MGDDMIENVEKLLQAAAAYRAQHEKVEAMIEYGKSKSASESYWRKVDFARVRLDKLADALKKAALSV